MHVPQISRNGLLFCTCSRIAEFLCNNHRIIEIAYLFVHCTYRGVGIFLSTYSKVRWMAFSSAPSPDLQRWPFQLDQAIPELWEFRFHMSWDELFLSTSKMIWRVERLSAPYLNPLNPFQITRLSHVSRLRVSDTDPLSRLFHTYSVIQAIHTRKIQDVERCLFVGTHPLILEMTDFPWKFKEMAYSLGRLIRDYSSSIALVL